MQLTGDLLIGAGEGTLKALNPATHRVDRHYKRFFTQSRQTGLPPKCWTVYCHMPTD